ncbi:protein of unknown function (plasmid) [Candidatus Promineifilum breve]|uniref:DUF4315 family protein n=1 Tax=Candidatus Promineifilum breve TaxID=1806508 RepID=A0A160T999_9CHLR|nr:hypothetical protein [Candidatus Promineifilum breve]CUS06419.1 protein of unknown function [Candidatus Promineifilum breve]
MKNLTNMTVEQLEKEIHTLDEKRSAIREEMRQVHAELDKRLAEQGAAAALERLSDGERRALLQMIEEAGGVESLAAVGVPGDAR